MVRISKKPPITTNWMQVELIHNVPNVLTSRTTLALAKKARETSGKRPIKIFNCIYCGRALKSIQALRGHLQFCPGKKSYLEAMENGFKFVIGSRVFTVKTKRWSWLRQAVDIEKNLNEQIGEGSVSEEDAITAFTWFVLGLQGVDTRSEAALEPAQVAEVTGS